MLKLNAVLVALSMVMVSACSGDDGKDYTPGTGGDTGGGGGDSAGGDSASGGDALPLGAPVIEIISNSSTTSYGAAGRTFIHLNTSGEPMFMAQSNAAFGGYSGLLATRTAVDTWTVEGMNRVDAFAIDASDVPHKAVAGLDGDFVPYFYHCLWDAIEEEWTYTSIEGSAARASMDSTDIAISAVDGRIHVVYQDTEHSDHGGVKYAVSNGATFDVEIIEASDATNIFGWEARIALTATDEVHVVYRRRADDTWTMRYGVRTGANTWSLEDISTDHADGDDTFFALDTNGNPSVVVAGPYWIRKLTGTWEEDYIDPDSDASSYTLLGVDFEDDGTPHFITFGSNYDFYYIRPTAGGFEASTPFYSEMVSTTTGAIVLDAQNMPHIGLAANSSYRMRYVHY